MLARVLRWLGLDLRRAARDLDCRLAVLESCPPPRHRSKQD
jgi:hypothetical protein